MKATQFFCLLAALVFLLTACSANILSIDGFEASFQGHMVELYGEYAPLTDIYPGENYLNLYTDGSGVIAFSAEGDEITWHKEDDTYYINVQGENCPAAFDEGILTMELEGAVITYVAEGAQAPEIPTTAPSEYDTDLTVPYGTYHGLTINEYGKVTEMADFYNGDCFIRLNENGMGILCLGGSEMQLAWELNGTELTVSDMNGINSIGYLENGVMVLDYMETGLQLAFAKAGADS